MAEKIIHSAKFVRKLVIGFWTAVIGFIMGILGFTSCSSPWPWNIVVAYGVPMASYRVNGIVSDITSDSVIPGIKVGVYYDDQYLYKKGDVTADALGAYLLDSEDDVGGITLYIKAEDVDGPENGEYLPGTFSVTMDSTDYNDTTKKYEKTVDIDLHEDL